MVYGLNSTKSPAKFAGLFIFLFPSPSGEGVRRTEETKQSEAFHPPRVRKKNKRLPRSPFRLPNLLIPTYIKKEEYFFITGLPANSNLVLYNALGQLVFKENNYQNKFNCTQISTGIYFYNLQLPTGELYGGKVYFEN